MTKIPNEDLEDLLSDLAFGWVPDVPSLPGVGTISADGISVAGELKGLSLVDGDPGFVLSLLAGRSALPGNTFDLRAQLPAGELLAKNAYVRGTTTSGGHQSASCRAMALGWYSSETPVVAWVARCDRQSFIGNMTVELQTETGDRQYEARNCLCGKSTAGGWLYLVPAKSGGAWLVIPSHGGLVDFSLLERDLLALSFALCGGSVQPFVALNANFETVGQHWPSFESARDLLWFPPFDSARPGQAQWLDSLFRLGPDEWGIVAPPLQRFLDAAAGGDLSNTIFRLLHGVHALTRAVGGQRLSSRAVSSSQSWGDWVKALSSESLSPLLGSIGEEELRARLESVGQPTSRDRLDVFLDEHSVRPPASVLTFMVEAERNIWGKVDLREEAAISSGSTPYKALGEAKLLLICMIAQFVDYQGSLPRECATWVTRDQEEVDPPSYSISAVVRANRKRFDPRAPFRLPIGNSLLPTLTEFAHSLRGSTQGRVSGLVYSESLGVDEQGLVVLAHLCANPTVRSPLFYFRVAGEALVPQDDDGENQLTSPDDLKSYLDLKLSGEGRSRALHDMLVLAELHAVEKRLTERENANSFHPHLEHWPERF